MAPTATYAGLGGFQARWDNRITARPGEDLYASQLRARTAVNFLVPSTPEAALEIMNTAVIECNASVSRPHQCVAYFLSALAVIFPGIKPIAKDILAKSGYRVVEVNENGLAEQVIINRGWIDISTAMVTFGELACAVYKNIHERNFPQFFQRRADALKGLAGVISDLNPEGGDVVLSLEASIICTKLCGCEQKLKTGLLKMLLMNRAGEDKINVVSAYLCEIIGWTGMAHICWIFEILCLTRSPVLKDSRVHREVLHLFDTYNAITRSDYPQYYRILNNTDANYYLHRDKLRILTEVARRIKATQQTNVEQYVSTVNPEIDVIITELVGIHSRHTTTLTNQQMQDVLPYLWAEEGLRRVIPRIEEVTEEGGARRTANREEA